MIFSVAVLNLLHFIYFENFKRADDNTIIVTAEQELLARQMQLYSIAISNGDDGYRKILEETILEYDSILKTITTGQMYNEKKISAPNVEISKYVAENNKLWDEYKGNAMLILTSSRDEPKFQLALAYVNEKTDELVATSDKIEKGYMSLANSKWEEADRMTMFFIFVTAIVSSSSYIIIRKSIKPIIILRKVIERFGRGEYDIKAKVMTSDEIGSLAMSFNDLAEIVKTRTRELDLKNKISEKVNVHLHELVNEENEMNAHLKSMSEKLRDQSEKLREVDVAKEEFSSMITHELKTPLFPIVGYCEMLQSGDYGELTDEQKEKIQIIYDSAQSLLQLVQDVLDIHKLELGKIQPHISDYDAKEMIDMVLIRFFPVAFERKIKLFNITEPEIRCRCDNERIIQVLNNIINNALKFVSDNTGQIEVSAKYNDGSVMFAIKDNGSGIPKEKQKNLFQKFYQVDSSITRKGGGTGLGLAICKGIVDIHKGKIWVESETGTGTTFFFSLPAG